MYHEAVPCNQSVGGHVYHEAVPCNQSVGWHVYHEAVVQPKCGRACVS